MTQSSGSTYCKKRFYAAKLCISNILVRGSNFNASSDVVAEMFSLCKLVRQKIFQPSGAWIPGVGQFMSDFQERVICDHIMLKRNVIVIVTATIFELFFQK